MDHQTSFKSSPCQKHHKLDLYHLLQTSRLWTGVAPTTVALSCGWKVNSSCSCCAIGLLQGSKPASNTNYREWITAFSMGRWLSTLKCIKLLKQACLNISWLLTSSFNICGNEEVSPRATAHTLSWVIKLYSQDRTLNFKWTEDKL